ncbi:MAG: hypothetical protein ABR611_02840 [Chthoniobacterales bacterium]
MMRIALLGGVLALTSRTAQASSELKLTVWFSSKVFTIGDTVDFLITFKNTSNQPIRVLPEVGLFSSDLLSIRKLGGGAKVEYVRAPVERGLDLTALSKYVVLLNPGDSLTRNLSAVVVSHLPEAYEKPETGLFLDFSNSAIKLPGFGKYEARADYDSTFEHPTGSLLVEDPKLWSGKVHSPAVLLEFRK